MGEQTNTVKPAKVADGGKKVLETAKNGSKVVVNKATEFSKRDFGKFKGLHIMIAGGVVVLVLLLVVLSSVFGGGKDVEYSVVYADDDGDLYLMKPNAKKEDDAIKLAGDTSSGVIYANTNNRYILFTKDSDLYLYDAKAKEETVKILSDVDDYDFTEDDKYVIAIDADSNLYSYNFKKDKERLDTDVSEIYVYDSTHIVYEKDGSVYVRSINAKKDDRAKITDEYNGVLRLSEDGKFVTYIDEDSNLMAYNISKKENNKIAGDVSTYYCDTQSCKKLYYVVTDDENDLYYYNGKEGTKVASDISYVCDSDVDEQKVVYTVADDGEYTLYYQKGTKDAAKIEDGLESLNGVHLFEAKEIYYINEDNELKYVKINGNKVGDVKSVADDVDYLTMNKNGYVFVADVDDDSNGTLYFAKGGKAKEIADDVYSSKVTVSKDGKRVYYLQDYKNTGDLYVTTGGKGKKIESDIRSYIVVKSNLIYMLKDYSSSKSRGDLFRSNGHKSVKLAENVQRLYTISGLGYNPEK